MQQLIRLILKYKKVYICVIAVYVALFVLTAYTLATKRDWNLPATPWTTAQAEKETAQHTMTAWPVSFRGTQPNTLAYAENLNTFFHRLQQGEHLRVLQIGDSHVRGNYLPNAVDATLTRLLGGTGLEGVDMDTAPQVDGGITFSYIAQNGAHASRFCEEDKMQEIADALPDLVIISFGTNEAHGHFNPNVHIQTLQMLTTTIKHRCPHASFLLTTPPGSYIRTYGHRWRDRRGRWHYNTSHAVNPRTEEVVRAIDTFAKDNHCALWNLFELAGGSQYATVNWRNGGFMQNDCIHYTAEGYTLQGTLLGEAIVAAYENYLQPHE